MASDNAWIRPTLAALAVAYLALGPSSPRPADAQSATYSLSGNMRSQIGNGLPLPVTFLPAPNGRVVFPSDAVAYQTTGPDPKAMTFLRSTMSPIWGPESTTVMFPVPHAAVLQTKTSLIIGGPLGGSAMFSAGGRTGPATLTWCPGQPLPTASFNPACTNAVAATAVHGATINASLRYQRTVAQFGGVNRNTVGGGMNVFIRAGATSPPCMAVALGGLDASCLAAISVPAINPSAVIGGAFGVVHSTTPPPSPGNVRFIGVLTSGTVTTVGPTPLGTVPKDAVKSWGGPWTTGKVTVRAPLANGGAETFYLQGSDNRVDGVGSISLVAGGVSMRSLQGDNGNRGWQNLVLGHLQVPAISGGGLLLLGTLFVGVTVGMLRSGRPQRRHPR